MSLNLNSVQLAGRVGKDAEAYTFGGGTKKVSFSLATNKRVKGTDGEWKDEAQWHEIEAWGKTAEFAESIKKGDEIYVDGTLEYKEYTTKQGEKRKSTVINVFDIKVITKRKDEKEGLQARAQTTYPQSQPTQRPQQSGGEADDLPW